MQVEHYQLALYLVFPRVSIPVSYAMIKQIADHAEDRFSAIALRH